MTFVSHGRQVCSFTECVFVKLVDILIETFHEDSGLSEQPTTSSSSHGSSTTNKQGHVPYSSQSLAYTVRTGTAGAGVLTASTLAMHTGSSFCYSSSLVSYTCMYNNMDGWVALGTSGTRSVASAATAGT